MRVNARWKTREGEIGKGVRGEEKKEDRKEKRKRSHRRREDIRRREVGNGEREREGTENYKGRTRRA